MSVAPSPTNSYHFRPLPASGESFITDAGLETELIFKDRIELPYFVSTVLLDSPDGRRRLYDYYASFVELAIENEVGILLETPTWRISSDWGERLGYRSSDLERLNHAAAQLLQDLRLKYETQVSRFVISGLIGPRHDGYRADHIMTDQEAAAYHSGQAASLTRAGVDAIGAMTITNSNEGLGIAQAANEVGLQAVLSFTVETDGKLPSGETLAESIQRIDSELPGVIAYYGINCAHPTHFLNQVTSNQKWSDRVGSIRANASRKSHAELDECSVLDEGDAAELAQQYAELQTHFKNLRVYGGCCGTDLNHVRSIANVCIR